MTSSDPGALRRSRTGPGPDVRNSADFATISLAERVTVEGVPAQGWHRDPSGAHDDRWFSAGRPTPLVRDHGVVSREDLPPDQQPGRHDPVDPAARAAQDAADAEGSYWRYGTVVVPCLVAFVAAGLIVAASLAFQPTHGFDLAGTAVAWVQADRAGQLAACVATAVLLIAAAQRPRWRRAIALTVWSLASLQFGFFLLAGSQYPGNSCTTRPGWASITLSYSEPGPMVTVPAGSHLFATVPAWGIGTATDFGVDSTAILREDCTVTLPGGGRRAVFSALKPGTTSIGSEQEPASPFFMPSWSGRVIVRPARN